MRRAGSIGALLLCLLPVAASAQTFGTVAAKDLDTAQTPQTSQGPMVVERIHNGFLAAPEFKFTEFNHDTAGLMGGYAGVVFADALFIGGGGYGTVTSDHGSELAYGGLIMQWFGRASDTFGYSARMLIGGGTSESNGTVQVVDRGRTSLQTVHYHQDFLVFEPEVNALVTFSKNLRLSAGVGYRFTGNGWYGPYYYDYGYPGHGPSGVTASIGLHIGGGR
jgi:hypothetical protein